MKGIQFVALEGKSDVNVKTAVNNDKLYLCIDISKGVTQNKNGTEIYAGAYSTVDLGDGKKLRMTATFMPVKSKKAAAKALKDENATLKERLAKMEAMMAKIADKA